MSCFIVPLAQAVATTLSRKMSEKNNKNSQNVWIQQLPKLELMLWGGAAMLIVDHILSGEVSWQYPFFTALTEAGGVQIMLKEMLTVGVPMSLIVTALWAGYVVMKRRLA
ncbi:MAG: hypothetical protein MJZ78_03485 [Bacteroidales bacterium]|nr:hypothetical protein [Bacteroidales bacterium]